jgi:SAM-dependent methyltransferase
VEGLITQWREEGWDWSGWGKRENLLEGPRARLKYLETGLRAWKDGILTPPETNRGSEAMSRGVEGVLRFLESYSWPHSPGAVEEIEVEGKKLPRFVGEFWTAKQRQAHSIHEISYRACFKPQLPRFFIELLTEPGDTVYDPFCGRGTTAIEAALLGRRVIANDANPLSRVFLTPRLAVPEISEVERRLKGLPVDHGARAELDLSMFYHSRTEAEIVSLRSYLRDRSRQGLEDHVDSWIRMVATNRLTGHSRGFFSVYTLPPNQAVSPSKQREINEKLGQVPEYRDTRALIMRKSRQLLRDLRPEEAEALRKAAKEAIIISKDARETSEIPSDSVHLTVTSPPFLDVVQYHEDNWLRCWFNDIEKELVASAITLTGSLLEWRRFMEEVFGELYRVTRPGGWVAFEVGEVRGGKVFLEDTVLPIGIRSGFRAVAVLINRQRFTKTSRIWGVENQLKGTNTNRIVLLRKEG